MQALFKPPLAATEAHAFVQELRSVNAEGVLDVRAGAAVSSDPDDNPVIQTAVSGGAEVLCTLDRHMRRIRKVRAYCATHGIEILTDVELLHRLRQTEA